MPLPKFYTLLGLSNKDPSENELKKAYKKAALKHHPDRNPNNKEDAEKKFKEISEAYSVLSDKEKKHIYDSYGEEGLKNGGPAGFSGFNGQNIFQSGNGTTFVFSTNSRQGFNHNDIFSQLFNDDDFSGFGLPKRKKRQNRNKSTEVIHKLSCSLKDLYNGILKKIKITSKKLNGIKESKVLEVNVKPGWKQNTKITFSNEGDELYSGKRQNIVFVVEETPHQWFKRNGDDLLYRANISQTQSEKGVKLTIPMLDNSKITQVFNDIDHNQEYVIEGKGMPMKNGGYGNLIIKFILV